MSMEVKQVSKHFGDVTAVDDVSFTLESGKIYGLLGRNGAGKSTLLNLISNRVFPNSGEITLDGETVFENDKVQGKIFAMSDQNNYPADWRISKVFKWTGKFYRGFDKEQALKLCAQFDLNPKKKVLSLSTGYRSVFKLIVALCVDVEYVFYDEPVLGLDAHFRTLFYRLLLEKYSAKPCTIVLSTHLIEEAAQIIEDVLVMKQGKLIYSGSALNLEEHCFSVSGESAKINGYEKGKKIMGTQSLGGMKTLYLWGEGKEEAASLGLRVAPMNLQEIFVEMTNVEGENQ